MAGILDLHLELALKRGWQDYRDDIAAFRGLFGAVSTTLVDGWHAQLVADPPKIRAYGAPGSDTPPAIVVKLIDEDVEQLPMGGAAVTNAAGVPVYDAIIRQRAQIEVFAPHPELARALFVCVRAILFRALVGFQKAGYLDLTYDAVEGLDPVEELAAEELGLFMRRVRVSARAHLAVEDMPLDETAPSPKSWFVFVEDIVTSTNPSPPPARAIDVDGTAGGVVPSSE